MPLDSDIWSPSVARYMDAVCDRFEAAHRSGQRPRLADYLPDTPAPEQPALLRELLALDLAYRSRGGELPTAEEYARQFPEYGELIREVFRQAARDPAASTSAHLDPPAARATPGGNGTTASGTLAEGLESGTEPEAPAAAAETPVHPPEPAVPGYEIIGILGQGGMGIVYRAWQVPLRRVVALKMLRPNAPPEAGQLRRFRAEAEAVARLQHPHIVQVYEVGAHAGLPYLVLEYVAGGSLAERLDDAPLPPDQAARLLETVARAVHYAHRQGIVHRDLKPANILLAAGGPPENDAEKGRPPAADWVPKVTDFGLAKRLDENTGQTRSGAIVGTPSYMSPEQAAGQSEAIGPAADVYALGVLLYEALTGRPPYRGATALETLAQVLTQEPVPPSRLQPGVPRDLETVCLKCLRKEPPQRYASAEAMADDLHRFLAGEPIRARPAPAWERLRKWVRRRPAAAALIAVSIVAVLAGVAYQGERIAYQGERIRRAEQEVSALQDLDQRRGQVQEWALKGQAAEKEGHLEEAITAYGKALTVIESDWRLASLKGDVEPLRQAAEEKLASQRARARADAMLTAFNRGLNEARAYGIGLDIELEGIDLSKSLKLARGAAERALALFGVSATEGGPIFAEPLGPDKRPLTPVERKAITAGCYELLLLLAEAQARQGTAQHVRTAVAVAKRADRLGPRTKAYHLRLARYLVTLHEEVAARQEEERARAFKPADEWAEALDDFLMGDDKQRQPGPENVRAAVDYFERAVGRQPDHFGAHFYLAVCYLRLSRPELAKGPLDTCLVLQPPDFLWVSLLRGFTHAQLGEFEAADADFRFAEEALKGNPNEDARYSIAVNRGVLRLLQKKYPEAIAELQRAIGLRPNDYQAYLDLAEVHRQQKRPDLTAKELDRALAAGQASEVGVPALQLIYRSRARLHAQQNDPDSELRDLRRIIALEPRGSKSLKLAEDHLECGQLLLRLQRFPEALTAYEAALKVQPTLAAARLGRCEALLALERYEEMVASLDKHLPRPERLKEPAKLYWLRGVARAWRLDYAGAVEEYNRALDVQRDSKTLALRGWAYLFQDALKPALHDFQEALDLDPNNGDAYSGRGYARVQLGQYRQGIGDAERALACRAENRRDPRMLCNAARVFALAVGRVDAERGHPSLQTLAERSGYQDRALDLLRTAVAAKPVGERPVFWQKIIAPDAALRPIRGSPGYGQLEWECARWSK